MTVRGISIEAYYKHIDSGKALTQWQKILHHFTEGGSELTRSELAEHLGLRLSSVCGRVNELLSASLIVEFPRRKCAITGEPAHPVGLPPQHQHDLFMKGETK